mgnify:CR=1 FL=1
MNGKRIGRRTVALRTPPSVLSFANIGGRMEGQGPLAKYFDELCEDSFFGEKTWEKAESAMQERVLRRALEQAGHSRLGLRSIFGVNGEQNEESIKQWQKAISAACAACETLQRQKMGALIVFERDTKLGEIAKSGTLVNADPTRELIGNVFFNKAPLHDGAMIIRDGRVYAAGCILPLSDNLQISRDLGTRHRAAVGMSENSDAVVVIVSEETGTISVAIGGLLKRHLKPETLEKLLINELMPQAEEPGADKPQLHLPRILKKRKEDDEENGAN